MPGEHTNTTPVVLLQAFAFTVFAIPSNYVITAVGAAGYLSSLIGLLCFVLWAVTAFLGYHHPIERRTPISAILALFWISTLVSYIRIVSVGTDQVRQLSADRELMMVAAISGVALTATEALRTKRQVLSVIEAMSWGVAFCSVVAAMQHWLSYDMTPLLGGLPGFELNGESSAFTERYGMVRVAGTALSPIEFGVACGMMLPLTIVRGIIKRDSKNWMRWAPLLLTLFGAVLSVSRSAVLAAGVSMVALFSMLPYRERRAALLLSPVALVLVFASVPGFMATMSDYITGASTDPSITTRTGDYDAAFALIREAVWIGHGAGWYVFQNALDILDNEYLARAINFGVIGVVALVVLLLGPAVVALRARALTRDPDLRLVSAALAAAATAGAASSTAFDSLSFPMFTGMVALVAGLAGACWQLGHQNDPTVSPDLPPAPVG